MFHMFQVIYAHEWMNDAHDHEMQVQLDKTNTRGVTCSIQICDDFTACYASPALECILQAFPAR